MPTPMEAAVLPLLPPITTKMVMGNPDCSCNKNIKLLIHSGYVITKGHTYLSKPAGKRSKSTKSEVFLKDFFNKFDDIGK